jgi:hypothetical protein
MKIKLALIPLVLILSIKLSFGVDKKNDQLSVTDMLNGVAYKLMHDYENCKRSTNCRDQVVAESLAVLAEVSPLVMELELFKLTHQSGYKTDTNQSLACWQDTTGGFFIKNTENNDYIGSATRSLQSIEDCKQLLDNRDQDLICAINDFGNFNLFHLKENKFMPPIISSGLVSIESCIKALKGRVNKLVCSPVYESLIGVQWQPLIVDSEKISYPILYDKDNNSGSGFKSISKCNESVMNQKNGRVCAKGHYFYIYDMITNSILASYHTVDECFKTILE